MTRLEKALAAASRKGYRSIDDDDITEMGNRRGQPLSADEIARVRAYVKALSVNRGARQRLKFPLERRLNLWSNETPGVYFDSFVNTNHCTDAPLLDLEAYVLRYEKGAKLAESASAMDAEIARLLDEADLRLRVPLRLRRELAKSRRMSAAEKAAHYQQQADFWRSLPHWSVEKAEGFYADAVSNTPIDALTMRGRTEPVPCEALHGVERG